MAGFVGYYGDMVNGMPSPLTQAPGKRYPDTLIGQTDVAPLLNLLSELPHGAPIAVDTETTGLFPYEDDVIRGVSIAFRTDGLAQRMSDGLANDIHAFYIPVGYPTASDNLRTQSQQMVFQAIKDLDPFLILHHGKFDFAFLRQLSMTKDGGVYFPVPLASPPQAAPSWWDTKVVAWLLDENMPTGLKEQAAFHFGEDSKDEQKAIKKLVREKGWDGLTPEDTALYAAKDADLTYRLYERQQELIDHPSTLGDIRPAIARELAIQGVLGRMEATGILINPELLEKMTEETHWRIETIEGSQVFANVNLKSPAQVGTMLHEMGALPENHPMTPSGKPSMNRAALESLDADSHPALALLLEHRRLQKAASGYLHPLKARIGSDGRVHAGFSSTGTVTGRFNCSNPNLQTVPRRDTLVGVRDLFIAEPGFELWEFDLSAAEMRVMAILANEQILIDALNDGTDVHGMLAAQVFGDKYTSLQRRYAKNLGYGWNYGLTSVKTAAKYIKGADGEQIAGKILAGLKKLYPNIYRLMGRTTRQADKAGFVRVHDTAWPGRYRRFRTPSVRRSPTFTALNGKVQGSISEIMKDVMLLGEPVIDSMGGRLCLQVHDSLVAEVPEGTGLKFQEALQAILDKVNPFDIAMIFDASPWDAHD